MTKCGQYLKLDMEKLHTCATEGPGQTYLENYERRAKLNRISATPSIVWDYNLLSLNERDMALDNFLGFACEGRRMPAEGALCGRYF